MISRKILIDLKDAVWGNNKFEFNRSALSSWTYPLNLNFTLENEGAYFFPKDERGVPIRMYKSVGPQYNPTRIATYALAHFNCYLTYRHDINKRIFMDMAEWFMQSRDGLWQYHFDWDTLRAPWISAMAQGEGISVLSRAYWLTQEDRFLEQALLASKPFSSSINDGGVRSRISGKWDFVEEYPSPDPYHTLNGFLFALVGICDLLRISSERREMIGFDPLVETLERNSHLWDLSYWSAYDLHNFGTWQRNPATVSYHRLHIALLTYLGHALEKENILRTARLWESYSTSMSKRIKALAVKILYRLEYAPSR